ncbi:MAG: aminopeptidase P family protein [Phycisphaerae bacterium]|nr:aminopeptidase P family protein [Phycisphaerae bacterium]
MSVAPPTRNPAVIVRAGVPLHNMSLYHRIRFAVGDPTAIIERIADGVSESILIIRDIEMERARRAARADRITSVADWAPRDGLSGDRETATAQAVAECVRRTLDGASIPVIADRSLPAIYIEFLHRAGIRIECDLELGQAQRRRKDASEVEHLRRAQAATEAAMRMACESVARAIPRRDGALELDGTPLTSERLSAAIDGFLLQRGYSTPGNIVAGRKDGGDCHHFGSGELRTQEPVIIDIFPRDKHALYHGDSTRTVVNGPIPPEVARMHRAVVESKTAATAATRAGATGHDVHNATITTLAAHGFARGIPAATDPPTRITMQHGTGHGIGLDGHEPPLLDMNGPELLDRDVVTIEPGLYSRAFGGVRVEDMMLVTSRGCENLGTGLPECLTWT